MSEDGMESRFQNLPPVQGDDSTETFTDWFNRMLLKTGLSVSELSEMTGISYVGLWNIKNGTTSRPKQKTRIKIQEAFKENFVDTTTTTSTEVVKTPGAVIGELEDFDPHSEDLPDCCGVHVFYDISKRPIYVGKVSSKGRTIRNRVREHEEKFWFKRPIVDHASFIRIDDPSLCAAVEKILIKFLKTNAVLNKDYVSRGD